MPFIGLALSVGGLALLCWLLFALAIYALPVFVGLSLGALAFRTGAGYGGAFVVAVVAGAAAFGLGRLAFSLVRSAAARGLIGFGFALPAACAGYQASFGLAEIVTPSHAWCVAFASIGALATGTAAWCRVAAYAALEPAPNAARHHPPLGSTHATGSG